MTQPVLPEDWQELLAGYVLETLEADEMTLVQRWLSLYPEVAVELERLQETWGTLPYSLPQQAPPGRLRGKVLASRPPQNTETPIQNPRRNWLVYGLSTGWALTAIALVTLALENVQLREENQRTEAVVASFTQADNYLYTLAGTDAASQARGRLVINPDQQSALIVTQDLPMLPSEEVYRLWALADTDPIYCGEFNPTDTAATNQWQLPSPSCASDTVQMLVTRELAATPLAPEGELVLQGQS